MAKIYYEKIKVGIVGFGGMANWHFDKMVKSGMYQPVGIFDIDTKKNEKAKEKGLKIYQTFDELLLEKDLKLVLIATPNDSHEEYAVRALSKGINVLCEKPVTMSSESLLKMMAASKAGGGLLYVHQNRRWDKDFLIIKSIYDSEQMKGVYKIDSNVTGSHGVPGEWRTIKAKGGGMLWDWGVHLIDQMLNLNSSKVVGVTCRASYIYGYDCDDGIYMCIEFEDGLVANINIDTNKFTHTNRWEVYAREGTAVVKDWSCKGNIIKLVRFFDSKNKGITAGNGFTKTMADRSKSTIIRGKLPKVSCDTGELYKNLYECITAKAKPIVTQESVLRCMRVMEAGFASMEKRTTIKTDI